MINNWKRVLHYVGEWTFLKVSNRKKKKKQQATCKDHDICVESGCRRLQDPRVKTRFENFSHFSKFPHLKTFSKLFP